MVKALALLAVLWAGVLLAESKPERVAAEPISAITKDVWLSERDDLYKELTHRTSESHDVKGARCRLIGFCVKARTFERRTPQLVQQAIAGLWLQDGTVALYVVSQPVPAVVGGALRPWEQGLRFTPECGSGKPEYVRAEELERDRTLIGKFVQTTTFGNFGWHRDRVIFMALDREWLSETVVNEVVTGLTPAEEEKRLLDAAEFRGDPLLPWDD